MIVNDLNPLCHTFTVFPFLSFPFLLSENEEYCSYVFSLKLIMQCGQLNKDFWGQVVLYKRKDSLGPKIQINGTWLANTSIDL